MRISLPFEISKTKSLYGSRFFAYIEGDEGETIASATAYDEQKLRRELREKILDDLRTHNTITRNNQRRILWCGDGTILFVEYWYTTWGYSICKKDRKSTSGGCWGIESFEEALNAAKEHAEQSYNGVVQETLIDR